jgi:hypothetical protein
MPARSALAGGAATGSMWRLAHSQHGSDQIVQRPGQVLLGDQDNLVIDAKMAERPSRNRAVGRQGGQGTCEEFLPRASVAGRGGVNHPAPHGAVRTDQGHDDPHQLSLSPPAAFRQADHDDGGLWARPAGSHALLTAESVTMHPQPSRERRSPRQSRREGLPRMTQRHEQPVADGQLNVK